MRATIPEIVTAPPLGGDWAENADVIQASPISVFDTPPEQRRILTGFKHIDEKIIIGPHGRVSFIGILAGANRAKSGLLLSVTL